MQAPVYFSEHKKLIKTLLQGTRKDLMKEARSQIKEVKKYNKIFGRKTT